MASIFLSYLLAKRAIDYVLLCLPYNRIEKKWEELQIEMGELSETRPQEGSDNTTRREHNSRAAC